MTPSFDETLSPFPPPRITPPAPVPREEQLRPPAFLRVLRRNPIETWTKAHFERPILTGRGLLGIGAVVSHPPSIRRVLLDNVANYKKDALQKRVLAPGLSDGLLTVEGDAWRVQRRAIAPIFTPRLVGSFAAPMKRVADKLVDRWSKIRPGRVIDVHKDMARVTLEILGETIFSGGLERDPDEFLAQMSKFFMTIGVLDPADLLDFPDWVPRLGQIRSRASIDFFEKTVDAIVERRRALIESGGAGPGGPAQLAAEGGRPGHRDRPHRRGGQGQRHHLHRRRPRDHRQRADLVAFPAVAFAGMDGAIGRGSRTRTRRTHRDFGGPPAEHARRHRGGDAALPARREPQPRGDRTRTISAAAASAKAR